MARAMTEQAKKEKSEYIITKAFELFNENTFKSFKMDELAKNCEISKGLLFKYFRTKEMLFLSMLDREYSKMLIAYESEFCKYEKVTPNVLKEVLVHLTNTIYLPDTMLIRLNMIKGSILEQNIDYEFARAQKLGFAAESNKVFQKIMMRLDGITPEQFMNIFNIHGSLLFGFMHSVTTSKVMKKVIEDEGLSQYETNPTLETTKALILVIDSYFNL